MGAYSVPESIRKMKPRGTMIKNISNRYYVYEFSNYTSEDGKRHTKMGKLIGTIKEGIGFIPNDTFAKETEITTLEFGEYAITLANSEKTLQLLKNSFNPQDAVVIYVVSLIHFIQGFVYLKDIKNYYDMSILSKKFPSLKLGYDALSNLYDTLGRRQTNVFRFEEKLIEECSRQIAIDGHVIGCQSTCNDLAEKGYKFEKIGEEQINLLMAYDVNTNVPLISHIYEGASNDKVSVRDLLNQVLLRNMLFLIDRGFYSAENIIIFSSNGNQYIIPIPSNVNIFKQAAQNLDMNERFVYQKGKKASVIEYKDQNIEGVRVLSYRDLNESVLEQENYLRHMNQGEKSYTQESFDKNHKYMGVTILQTNIKDKTPEEIYALYKKRWSIETYFNYFKNKAGYSCLHVEDYYKTQGLAFVMLISSLIHHELVEASKAVEGKSLETCLLEARMVKAHKQHSQWIATNYLKKQIELFAAFKTNVNMYL